MYGRYGSTCQAVITIFMTYPRARSPLRSVGKRKLKWNLKEKKPTPLFNYCDEHLVIITSSCSHELVMDST